MVKRATLVLLSALVAVSLVGCGGGATREVAVGDGTAVTLPQRPEITPPAGDSRPEITPPAGDSRPEITPPAGGPLGGGGRPEMTPPAGGPLGGGGGRPEITPPAGGLGGGGQLITINVTEEQLNQAISLALSAASDTSIQAISVDLQANIISVSASVLVEGQSISTTIGLTPVVNACTLSLTVAVEPSQPSGIPAPMWNMVVEEVVAAIEAAVVTPQHACVQSIVVSDGQMQVTVGRQP